MAQVLQGMKDDKRRVTVKRVNRIYLFALIACTCFSGCRNQSIADINEKSLQAQEEPVTEYKKEDVVIQSQPEEKTKESLREMALTQPLPGGNRLLKKNETAEYRGVEISVVDVILADDIDSIVSAGLIQEEFEYFLGENDIRESIKNEEWEYVWPFVRIKLKNTTNETQSINAGQLELYNVYEEDGNNGTAIKITEGASEVYNADYAGTSHRCWVLLEPGEERIVTVSYEGITKYQSSGRTKEGVIFTDIPVMENVYMKTYDIGNLQEGEALICLNIKNGMQVSE